MRKTIQILKKLPGYKPGDTVEIDVVKEGNKFIPVDSFFRKRLKDSEIDDCVKWVDDKKDKK